MVKSDQTPRGGEPDRPDAISVVVPTYNRAGSLEAVVRPLLADPAASEVIVVIDGCRDGSLEAMEALAQAEPRLRPLFIENGGEMSARQAGAEAAGEDVVLFIDDDVRAEPGLVSGHARGHRERVADVVVGYMPVASSGRPERDGVATRIYAREYEGRCAIYERDAVSVLREFWAGNFSMRRRDCLTIGMRNPAYTERYHPDRDFGLRCLEAGLTGRFDRSLRAAHLHQRSVPAFVKDARSQGAARMLMAELHSAFVLPLAGDEFARNLPSPAGALVAFARRPRACRCLIRGLEWVVGAAGTLRLWQLEDNAARILRRIAQQRGAIEHTRGHRVGDGALRARGG